MSDPMAGLNAQSANWLDTLPEEQRLRYQNQQQAAQVPVVWQDRVLAMTERIERLEVALRRIADWGIAYPEDAFPPPGEGYYANAHRILGAHTLSLDRIAADCMRHAVHGCARIAREALDGKGDD